MEVVDLEEGQAAMEVTMDNLEVVPLSTGTEEIKKTLEHKLEEVEKEHGGQNAQ